MEKRFIAGDKVYWNAGWNHHDHWKDSYDKDSGREPTPVGWMIRGPFDFAYYSATEGTVVLYEEGERSMQDSFAVSEKYVIPAKDYKHKGKNV